MIMAMKQVGVAKRLTVAIVVFLLVAVFASLAAIMVSVV